MLDDFYDSLSKPRSVTDLSDLELAHLVLGYVKAHAFLALVNVEEAKKDIYKVKDSFSMQEVMLTAITRAKSNRSVTENYLSGRISKATDVSIVGGNLVMMVAGAKEEIKMERGMYKVSDDKTTEASQCATILVQTFKPEVKTVDKRHISTVPVPTDTSGFLYPRYGRLPDVVRDVYAVSRDVPELHRNLVALISKAATTAEYCQLSVLVPYMAYTSAGSAMTRMFTAVYADATPERAASLSRTGIKLPKNTQTGQFLVRAYAPPPSLKDHYGISEAYTYLAKSREIRGENGGGVSALTALYYHGDIPLSFWRTYSASYNILSVIEGIKQGAPGYPKIKEFSLLESTSISQPVFDILRLNVTTSTFSGADYSVNPNYGVQPLSQKGTYVQFHQKSRNFSINSKGVLTFEKSFNILRDEILRDAKSSLNSLPNATVHHFFHVVACAEVISTCQIVASAHPHAGFVWIYVPPRVIDSYMKVVIGSPKAIKDRETKFANRLVLSNAYKNYYPFHRIPFFKCDKLIPCNPSVTLLRRAASYKNSPLYVFDFVPETDYKEETPEAIREHDEKFSELLAKLQLEAEKAQSVIQDKLMIPVVESMSDFYAQEPPQIVPSTSLIDESVTFAPPREEDGF